MPLRRRPAAFLAVGTALALLVPFSAQAQPGHAPNCDARGQSCATPDHSESRKHTKATPSARAKGKTASPALRAVSAPHKGAKVHNARHMSTSEKRHLPPLPKGHSYRVQDGHVLRVSNDTQKIVAVVGLLSALLN